MWTGRARWHLTDAMHSTLVAIDPSQRMEVIKGSFLVVYVL